MGNAELLGADEEYVALRAAFRAAMDRYKTAIGDDDRGLFSADPHPWRIVVFFVGFLEMVAGYYHLAMAKCYPDMGEVYFRTGVVLLFVAITTAQEAVKKNTRTHYLPRNAIISGMTALGTVLMCAGMQLRPTDTYEGVVDFVYFQTGLMSIFLVGVYSAVLLGNFLHKSIFG